MTPSSNLESEIANATWTWEIGGLDVGIGTCEPSLPEFDVSNLVYKREFDRFSTIGKWDSITSAPGFRKCFLPGEVP